MFSIVAKRQQVQGHRPQLQRPRKQQYSWPMDGRYPEGGGPETRGEGRDCCIIVGTPTRRKRWTWGGGARVRLFPAAVCESTAALQLGKRQDDCTEEGQLFLS